MDIIAGQLMSFWDWFKRNKQEKQTSEFDPDAIPHWARVAFAARCARRIQVYFREHDSDVPGRMMDAMENATTLAEQSARNGVAADNAEEMVKRALQITCDSELKTVVMTFAANAAQAVASGPQKSNAWAWHNYEGTRKFAEAESAPELFEQAQRDFRELHRRAETEQWNDASPVDPSVLD